MICDEAHRTTGVTLAGEDESNFVRVHDDDYLRRDRRLYMTATPRIFDDDVKDKADEHSAELASMDDETRLRPGVPPAWASARPSSTACSPTTRSSC